MDGLGAGTCIVDDSVLSRLDKLWTGFLVPDDMNSIEAGIRVILLYEKLLWSKASNAWSPATRQGDGFQAENQLERPGKFPLSDDVLRYSFSDDSDPHVFPVKPPPDQIVENLRRTFESRMIAALPDSFEYRWQMMEFLDRWYVGDPTDHIVDSIWVEADGGREKISKADFIANAEHAALAGNLVDEISYLLQGHSSGYGVCSLKPLKKLCEDQVFSVWPEELLHKFGEEYMQNSRRLRGPGVYFDVPPFVALVLSRAERRDEIPEVIRDLRDELEKPRKKLWELVHAVWDARYRRKQMRALDALSDAAESFHAAAFPRRTNVLRVGLKLAGGTPSSVASATDDWATQKSDKTAVGAVSFASHLADAFRRDLRNETDRLYWHLSSWERNAFGL